VDDTALFAIHNCGMPLVGLYVGYFSAAIFAITVAVISTLEMRNRKQSTRNFMLVGAAWNFLIPFLELSHFLEGNRFGTQQCVPSSSVSPSSFA